VNSESDNSKLTGLFAALLSGLLAGSTTAIIHAQSGHDTGLLFYIKPILIALSCYLLAAVVSRYISSRTYSFAEWPVVSVLGTVLFVCVRLVPAVVQGWFVPATLKPSLSTYVLTEISAAASVVGFLLLLTLPASAIAAYVVKLISVSMNPRS